MGINEENIWKVNPQLSNNVPLIGHDRTTIKFTFYTCNGINYVLDYYYSLVSYNICAHYINYNQPNYLTIASTNKKISSLGSSCIYDTSINIFQQQYPLEKVFTVKKALPIC